MIRSGLLLALVVGATSAVHANDPENYIQYRQAVMKAIGGHMGASSQLVRGRVSDEGALAVHAQALATLNRDIPKLFPDGSDFGESASKAEIWSDPDGFDKAASRAAEATEAFAAAVADGDGERIGVAFREVGDSCKGCHQDYRVKKED